MEKTKFDLLFEDIMQTLNTPQIEDGVVEKTDEITEATVTCTKCELCGNELHGSEAVFNFYDEADTEYDCLCTSCAEQVYDEHKDEIEDGIAEMYEKSDKYSPYKKCESCGGLTPERELKNTDSGDYCEYCIEGLISRGEKVSINYN